MTQCHVCDASSSGLTAMSSGAQDLIWLRLPLVGQCEAAYYVGCQTAPTDIAGFDRRVLEQQEAEEREREERRERKKAKKVIFYPPSAAVPAAKIAGYLALLHLTVGRPSQFRGDCSKGDP